MVVQNPFRVQLQSSGTTRLKSRVFSFQRLLISSQEIGLCEGGGSGGGGEREDLSVHLMPTFSRLPSGKFWWRVLLLLVVVVTGVKQSQLLSLKT